MPVNPKMSKEEAVFDAAIAIEDPLARATYLDEACEGDPALRAALEELLTFHDRADRLAAPSPLGDEFADPDAQPGTVLGRYRFIAKIGEGGFGSVYRAEQLSPVQREVAIKLVRPGMKSREIIGRFEAERQALAMMSHANIATVLDAGATPAGCPYFVMELVEGPPIDDYCDACRMPVAQRLQLFLAVCQAVQHAHHKGIVHRDLKPSNVLVAGDNGRAMAKVIDFGIAKAMYQPSLESGTGELGSMLGTPEYMSPEQLQGGADIDTRADVYALGGMLYKLLTGLSPLDHGTLASRNLEDVCRAIREVEPLRPSSRLQRLARCGSGPSGPITRECQSTNVDSNRGPRFGSQRQPTDHAPPGGDCDLERIAVNRDTQPRALRRLLRGDLDWIVMKALEKNRARRYETVHALARDIERYLDHRPVAAGPPSHWYVAGKFIRRHRSVVTAAALVTAALAVGSVMAVVGFVHAERARQHAEHQWQRAERERQGAEVAREQAVVAGREAYQARQAAELERYHAQSAADRAQRVASLLQQLLGTSHPAHGHPADYTVRQLLDDFADSLDEQQLEGQPEIEASVRRTIGRSYLGIGDLARAGPHLERALELRRRLLGDAHVLTAQSLLDYATFLLLVPRLEEAERLAEAVIGTLATLEPNGELAEAYYVLARVRHEYGDRESEERLMREAWSLCERVHGRDHPLTINLQACVATTLSSLGQRSRAEKLARDALDRLRTRLPPEHASIAELEVRLASILYARGRFDESERLLRHAMVTHRKALGADSYSEAVDLTILAELLSRTGRLDEAESAARRAVRIAERAPVGQNILQSRSHRALAIALQETNPAESVVHWDKAIEYRRQATGDRAEVGRLLNRRADLLEHLGRFDEAVVSLRDALAICQSQPDPSVALLAGAYLRLAEARREAGRPAEARETLHRAFFLFSGSANMPLNRFVLVEALVDLGGLADAEVQVDQLERLCEGDTRALARGMPLTARARLLMARGDCATAERHLREAIRRLRWPEHPRGRMRTAIVLGRCLMQTNRFDEAEQLLLRLVRRSQVHYLRAEDNRRLLKTLVDLYSAWNKPDEANHWRAQLPQTSDG